MFLLTYFVFNISLASCTETNNTISPELVVFAQNITAPVCITNAGDDRLFVVNQHGQILIINTAGSINSVPFLDITDRVTFGGERGLLGLAFHPEYKTNGYFYVNYVGKGDSTHISRFSANTSNSSTANPLSEKKIMTISQPFTNHNGGDLHFGKDGYLYIGLGDGGSGGDPGNRAQNLMDFHGKILRIDVDNGNPYSIPPSNPFVGSLSALNEIWAYGLRNPWRFSFDRLTGDLWIADVGQNSQEEINFQAASSIGGENYGWRCYEGNEPYNFSLCNEQTPSTFPIHTYPHGPECSITGGYVNRFSESSPYYGYYFFADYCSGKIWTIHSNSNNWITEEFGNFAGKNFSTFGESSDGQLYIADLANGVIYKIVDDTTAELKKVENQISIINNQNKILIKRIENINPMQLSFYNSMGINCFTLETNSLNYNINLVNFPKGVYLLAVKINDIIYTHKTINN